MFSWSNLYYAPGDFVIKKFKTLVSKHYTLVEFRKKIKIRMCLCPWDYNQKEKKYNVRIQTKELLQENVSALFQLVPDISTRDLIKHTENLWAALPCV